MNAVICSCKIIESCEQGKTLHNPCCSVSLFILLGNVIIAGETPGDYKDLKPNNPNIKVEDGTLTINNIQKTNEGYYLCEAVNGIGSGLSAVILISVQGMSHVIIF